MKTLCILAVLACSCASATNEPPLPESTSAHDSHLAISPAQLAGFWGPPSDDPHIKSARYTFGADKSFSTEKWHHVGSGRYGDTYSVTERGTFVVSGSALTLAYDSGEAEAYTAYFEATASGNRLHLISNRGQHFVMMRAR